MIELISILFLKTYLNLKDVVRKREKLKMKVCKADLELLTSKFNKLLGKLYNTYRLYSINMHVMYN